MAESEPQLEENSGLDKHQSRYSDTAPILTEGPYQQQTFQVDLIRKALIPEANYWAPHTRSLQHFLDATFLAQSLKQKSCRCLRDRGKGKGIKKEGKKEGGKKKRNCNIG